MRAALPWAAVLFALAGGWAWAGSDWPLPPPERWNAALAAAAVIVAAACLIWWQCGRARQRRAAERFCDDLFDLDLRHLSRENMPPALSLPPAGSQWRRLGERLREWLLRWSEEIQQLHHQQAALEVRCRQAQQEAAWSCAILEAISDPVLAVDDSGHVVIANGAARELFGADRQAREHRTVEQWVRSQKLLEMLAETRHGGQAPHRTDELAIAGATGTERSYRVHCARVDSNADAPAGPGGVVAVLRDTNREKALQKRHAEFVSAVSHEMKTPLAGIKAYVELLADGEAEDEQTREEFLRVINGQADRLQRLIDNLLNLARIEAGVVQVNKKSQSLNQLLEEALRVVRPAAEAKSIRLEAELSPLYLGVYADRDMLLQAAINLLSNAVKYTPEGGRVAVRSRMADDEVMFEVEDTGVGLSPEDCQRVFEKFYRVKKNRQMASGTGLGLPLARHIVEDVHGGRLSVRSRLGEGSTFTVSLPNVGASFPACHHN